MRQDQSVTPAGHQRDRAPEFDDPRKVGFTIGDARGSDRAQHRVGADLVIEPVHQRGRDRFIQPGYNHKGGGHRRPSGPD